MSGVTQIVFTAIHLDRERVEGQEIIEVGSCDFNGSVRPLIECWKPKSYIGVDIIAGRRVDRIVNADDLLNVFGEESFDIVLSLEMLEHSQCWWTSISNMKRICRRGGLIVLTTRSHPYPCHGFPNDYWRFDVDDMKKIFSDFEVLSIDSDWNDPGVVVAVKKPSEFQERDCSNYGIYSMLTNTRERQFPRAFAKHPYYRRLAFKQFVKRYADRMFLGTGRAISRMLSI